MPYRRTGLLICSKWNYFSLRHLFKEPLVTGLGSWPLNLIKMTCTWIHTVGSSICSVTELPALDIPLRLHNMMRKKAHRLAGTYSSREMVLNPHLSISPNSIQGAAKVCGCGSLEFRLESARDPLSLASSGWWQVFHLEPCLIFMCLTPGRSWLGLLQRGVCCAEREGTRLR